jgi:hypothetical protein
MRGIWLLALRDPPNCEKEGHLLNFLESICVCSTPARFPRSRI